MLAREWAETVKEYSCKLSEAKGEPAGTSETCCYSLNHPKGSFDPKLMCSKSAMLSDTFESPDMSDLTVWCRGDPDASGMAFVLSLYDSQNGVLFHPSMCLIQVPQLPMMGMHLLLLKSGEETRKLVDEWPTVAGMPQSAVRCSRVPILMLRGRVDTGL